MRWENIILSENHNPPQLTERNRVAGDVCTDYAHSSGTKYD